jgi:hypothetical protein
LKVRVCELCKAPRRLSEFLSRHKGPCLGCTRKKYPDTLPRMIKAPRRPKSEGYVYVAHDGRWTKIGIARDVDSRMRGHVSSNPTIREVTRRRALNYKAVEQELLARFREVKVSGEWVDAPPEAVIRALEEILQEKA